MDCWSIGEQEAALDLVVSSLLAQDIPISESARVLLAVTSEVWGRREALEDRTGKCRSISDDDSSVRLLAPADAVSLVGTSFSDQPEWAELLVVLQPGENLQRRAILDLTAGCSPSARFLYQAPEPRDRRYGPPAPTAAGRAPGVACRAQKSARASGVREQNGQ